MRAARSTTEAKRVLVVDDHPLTREGIKNLLAGQADLTVCGEAGSLAEARALIEELGPDLILLDLHLPDGEGLTLLKEVRSRAEPPKVILLTAHNDQDDTARKALTLGAGGFVNKQLFGDQVLTIVRDVLAGKTYLSPDMIDRLVRRR